jgi:MFS family permease
MSALGRGSMRLQVAILASAQALVQTASVLVMTVGGLAGALVAPAPALATAPIAAMFLGTAAATFPASLLMARVGRRPGFVLGASLGAGGGMVATAGVLNGSLLLLAAGTFLVGVYQGFAQFYRFAAGEVADDAFRPRAIALVVGGGVVAALAGPLLARLGGPLLPAEYAGSLMILALVSTAAAALLLALRIPSATAFSSHERGRPWPAVVSQPAYLVALFGAATGGGVMILAMTATPIAMAGHDHGLPATATVIQLHVLGMFLPSFVTGSLIMRFGVLRIMLAGVGLLAAHVLATLTGTGFPSYASALVLLGLGWNFLFIGGTSLLADCHTAAEKGTAQATNDMTVYAVGLGASLSAGALMEAIGWRAMNLALLPWLAAAAAAILWLAARPAQKATFTPPMTIRGAPGRAPAGEKLTL